MVRIVGRIVQGLVVLTLVLYAVDWGVMRYRMSHGNPYRMIVVHQFLASPLKGNKTVFDLDGSVEKRCSKSIFPQGDDPPCWWLERHTTEWE
jgi:hypothetical protein